MSRVRTLGCLVFCLFAVAGAQAQDHQARDWVERAAKARTEHSFIGDFIYQHDSQIQTLRIWHAGDTADGIQQRIVSLSGDPKEILRSDGRVTCIFADDQPLVVDQRQIQASIGDRIPTDVDRLLPHYGLVLLGPDRIADRSVVGVALQPADSYRYGYELWFDEQTGLLLGAELRDNQSQVIERIMMLDFKLQDSINPQDLAPSLSGEGFTWLKHPGGQSDAAQPPEGVSARWEIGELPPGFELEMDRMQMLPGHDAAVRHLLFSDGLTAVSVYIEAADERDGLDGASKVGALSAFGRDIAGYRVIAVGEVPAATVEALAYALNRGEN